jgi:voltage-dependent potassium channel beta subunit
MEYRSLGKSGLQVSAISLGSWMTFGQSVDDKTTEACMKTAFDNGINFFDGAEAYGMGAAETAMGKVFKNMPWERDELIISTKVTRVGEKPTRKGICRKRLVEAVDAALQRMNLDYVDMCFCHRPDGKTPMEEIVHTMNELIQRGKIFYWGTSEFSQADLMELYAIAERDHLVGPTMEQTGYNMLGRGRMEKELVPLFDKYDMGSTVYSPLHQGILTGKYNDGVPEDSRIGETDQQWLKNTLTEEKIEKARQLTKLAEGDLGIDMPSLALAWVLKNPNVSTAIIGSTKPHQIEQNIKAVEMQKKLTDDVMERIEEILANKP